jgi:acetyl esterase/lipase
MRLTVRCLPVLILAAAPAAAQQQSRPIYYEIPARAPVVEKRDITYKDADGRSLKLDVYMPGALGVSDRRPVVVFVVGGVGAGVEPRTWPGYASWGRLAAASGFIGVTFTHRLGFPKRYYKEAASDLRDLLGFLRTHAEAYHLDAGRVALVVYSGGGPLLTVPFRDRPASVRCIVGFYPFLDTDHVDPVAAQTPPDEVREFSPLRHLEPAASMPPVLILRAGRDGIAGVNASIDRFAVEALSRNLPFTLANHPDGEHGFDARNDVPRTRELIAQAVQFLHAHLAR